MRWHVNTVFEVGVVVDSILSVGLQGVQTGVSNARKAAEDIVAVTTADSTQGSSSQASPVTSSDSDQTNDLATALVNLKISEHQVQASTAVIKTADEMIGTLINIKA